MGDVFFGVGTIIWLLLAIIGLFFAVLAILMPWFVYQIRLEVRDINNHLVELKKIVSGLSSQLIAAQNAPQEISSEIIPEQIEEDVPVSNPDIRQNSQAKEVPNNDMEDDLRYAPPELKN